MRFAVGFMALFAVVFLAGSAIPAIWALQGGVTQTQAQPAFQFLTSGGWVLIVVIPAALALIGGVVGWALKSRWSF